jgi:hypothetical protein
LIDKYAFQKKKEYRAPSRAVRPVVTPLEPNSIGVLFVWRGYSGLKTPLRSTQKFLRETLMGEGVALRGLRPRWRLRRPRHVGFSCDVLELRDPSVGPYSDPSGPGQRSPGPPRPPAGLTMRDVD